MCKREDAREGSSLERVYNSEKEVTMAIILQVENGEYVRKNIDVNIIDREEYLFFEV